MFNLFIRCLNIRKKAQKDELGYYPGKVDVKAFPEGAFSGLPLFCRRVLLKPLLQYDTGRNFMFDDTAEKNKNYAVADRLQPLSDYTYGSIGK